MATFCIKKGRNIPLKGAASKEIINLPVSQRIAIQPQDFRGLKLRPIVKVNDPVRVGTPILMDKNNPDVRVLSPASGRVVVINRGEKRVLLEIVIELDGKQEAEGFSSYSQDQLKNISREDAIKSLLQGGMWPVIRQRPFSRVANPHDKPKSIFIHAMNTEPLAPDVDFILSQEDEREFQAGLEVIKKLTKGQVYLCAAAGSKSKSITGAQGVEVHYFAGQHPAGNVSTHIHYLNPINKGDIVWYVEAQDLLKIGALFLKGNYPSVRTVIVTGEGAKNRLYVKTIMGSPVSALLQGSDLQAKRCISGSVLTGKNIGANGFLRFYDSQFTIIPEGGERQFLGWLTLGFGQFTLSRTCVSAFLPCREYSLDTDKNGSDRAIVMNQIYDSLVPLDILTYFLVKAALAGDIEEMEKLGILECDEEDFALCTFACPSKVDVGGIIRQGLDLIEKEG